ncbi:hypothetical protein [Cloacibacillus porcorum]|uniref:hypothetical protein n=1 Tax=Cloacibacillus porcorum TaxID=1197717 RepID=UPI002673EE3B|nr:hypothetical protein [Cloacibacillus porcorum]
MKNMNNQELFNKLEGASTEGTSRKMLFVSYADGKTPSRQESHIDETPPWVNRVFGSERTIVHVMLFFLAIIASVLFIAFRNSPYLGELFTIFAVIAGFLTGHVTNNK